jgi:hypothetical protein
MTSTFAAAITLKPEPVIAIGARDPATLDNAVPNLIYVAITSKELACSTDLVQITTVCAQLFLSSRRGMQRGVHWKNIFRNGGG